MSNHPDRQHHQFGRLCPVTGAHCYDPTCGSNLCLRNRERRHELSHVEEKLIGIIADQVHVINCLVKEEHRASPAKALTASYAVVTEKGDINILNTKKSIMAQTITVLAGQNTVPAQLIPVASDNVTVEPISTITPGSEVYTTSDPSIATAAAVPGGAEGQYTVNRVPGAVGTVTLKYTATTPDGRTITNVDGLPDTFIFQGQPTNVASALTSSFGTPTA